MPISTNKLPKNILHMYGQVDFKSEDERILWAKDFVYCAEQKLRDTRRWTKQGLLQNLRLLTHAEREKLISALNLKTYFIRADRARKKGFAGMFQARGLAKDYHELSDSFFEGKLRDSKAKSVEDVLND